MNRSVIKDKNACFTLGGWLKVVIRTLVNNKLLLESFGQGLVQGQGQGLIKSLKQ